MKHYGTLNEEERGRDIVPDSQQKRVILGLMAYSIVRGAGTFIVGKDRASTPRLSLWSPLKMGGFMIALDYFFYVYHRATHEVSLLFTFQFFFANCNHDTVWQSLVDTQATVSFNPYVYLSRTQ